MCGSNAHKNTLLVMRAQVVERCLFLFDIKLVYQTPILYKHVKIKIKIKIGLHLNQRKVEESVRKSTGACTIMRFRHYCVLGLVTLIKCLLWVVQKIIICVLTTNKLINNANIFCTTFESLALFCTYLLIFLTFLPMRLTQIFLLNK